MIQGHIDLVSRTRVEGWIFCARLRLVGARVLAFIDETCVGGGTVDVFRQDLADAGLGDGMVGFGFAIALEPWQDPRVLDIRLEGGAFLMKQSATCLLPRDDLGEDRRRQARDPAALSWMLAKGWLTQAHYDALRLLGQFGVYAQGLRLTAREPEARCDEVALLAADLAELHMHQPIAVEIRESVRAGDLAPMRREVRGAFPWAPPVVGLWATGVRHVNVVEGSHLRDVALEPGGGVEYAFGDRQLLMLDLDGAVSFPQGEGDAAFVAFVPSRPQA